MEHWIWQDVRQAIRWLELTMLASWKPDVVFYRNNSININRGQLVTTYRALARRWKTNHRIVASFIRMLEKADMIVCDRNSKQWVVITIVNYEKYQREASKGQNPDEFEPNSIGVLSDLEDEKSDKKKSIKDQDGHQSGNHDIKNNNINNKNSSSSSTREENLKFFEELKNNENEIEDLAKLLECEAEKIRSMMEKYIIEAKDEEHESAGSFRTHFIHWARKHIEINKKKEYGSGKKTATAAGGTSEDRYANRRGTDAKDHAEEDYNDTF